MRGGEGLHRDAAEKPGDVVGPKDLWAVPQDDREPGVCGELCDLPLGVIPGVRLVGEDVCKELAGRDPCTEGKAQEGKHEA